MTNPTTTQTNYGPALYRVNSDGLLWMSWQNVTVNRVQYRSVSISQSDVQPLAFSCYLYRVDGKEPTPAAHAIFYAEAKRLRAVLVTPEATARARAEEARAELTRREQATREAQEAEARARAEFSAATAALLMFEPLNAERLDDVEDGAA